MTARQQSRSRVARSAIVRREPERAPFTAILRAGHDQAPGGTAVLVVARATASRRGQQLVRQVPGTMCASTLTCPSGLRKAADARARSRSRTIRRQLAGACRSRARRAYEWVPARSAGTGPTRRALHALEGERTGATFSFIHKSSWRTRIDEARQAVTGARAGKRRYTELGRLRDG